MAWFNLQNISEIHLQNIVTLIEFLMRPTMHIQNLEVFMYFRLVAKKLM